MQESTFCDPLGAPQRQWLRDTLGLTAPKPTSAAPKPTPASRSPALRLVLSSSVVLASIGYSQDAGDGLQLVCGGDDWDCYRPARVSCRHGCNCVLVTCVWAVGRLSSGCCPTAGAMSSLRPIGCRAWEEGSFYVSMVCMLCECLNLIWRGWE